MIGDYLRVVPQLPEQTPHQAAQERGFRLPHEVTISVMAATVNESMTTIRLIEHALSTIHQVPAHTLRKWPIDLSGLYIDQLLLAEYPEVVTIAEHTRLTPQDIAISGISYAASRLRYGGIVDTNVVSLHARRTSRA